MSCGSEKRETLKFDKRCSFADAHIRRIALLTIERKSAACTIEFIVDIQFI